MDIIGFRRIKWLSLAVIFSLVLFGVPGCWNSEVEVDCPEDENGAKWVWDGTVCSLRRDGFNWGISSIAPALDDSDDLYVVGSFTRFKNKAVKPVARVNNDGSLDRGFKTDTDFFAPTVVAAASDRSGDIYIGGLLGFDGSTYRGVARLNLDGSLDAGFYTGAGIGREVSAITPTTDGSGDVYVGGLSITPSGATFENGPLRLNSDGSRDHDFAPAIRSGEEAIALAADGSGDIYVSMSLAPYIARLHDDGSLDAGFDPGLPGFDRGVMDIAVATDGSGDVYVAGFFAEFNGTRVNGLARLNRDGSLDTGFAVASLDFLGGLWVLPLTDNSGDVYAHASNISNENIVRLNADGSVDTGFGNGSTGVNRGGTISDVAIAADGSGDIFVAGDFYLYNSKSVAMLVRLTAQGALID